MRLVTLSRDLSDKEVQVKVNREPKICTIIENKLWCEPYPNEDTSKCRYIKVPEKSEPVLVCPPKKVNSLWKEGSR